MSVVSKKNNSVLGIGSGLVFLSLVALVFYLFLFLNKKIDTSNQSDSQNSAKSSSDNFIKNDWVEFVNTDYGYKIPHPPLLTKNEYKNEGGYINFVKFEETEHSLGKGIAIGVSNSSLSDEIERTKKDMAKFEGAKLVSDEKLNLTEYDGFLLEYDIENNSGGESRTIVFIKKEYFIYSISTVPEQMQKVLSGFSFL